MQNKVLFVLLLFFALAGCAVPGPSEPDLLIASKQRQWNEKQNHYPTMISRDEKQAVDDETSWRVMSFEVLP